MTLIDEIYNTLDVNKSKSSVDIRKEIAQARGVSIDWIPSIGRFYAAYDILASGGYAEKTFVPPRTPEEYENRSGAHVVMLRKREEGQSKWAERKKSYLERILRI